MERLQPVSIRCIGGLDLTQDTYLTNPGGAVALQNFEPNIHGGYRRISGYDKYSSTIVPGQGSVLGVAVFGGNVIAVRRIAASSNMGWYTSSGGAWSAAINTTAHTYTTDKVRFAKYNWNGTNKIVFVDGVNNAATWDGTTWTEINDADRPVAPKYVAEYKNHIFYAGYTGNAGAIKWCEPNTENDFDVADGAGELVVGDLVKGLKVWRDQLIIFCKSSIFRLVGSTDFDFQVIPITRRTGCIHPDSIQEANGDIIYLSQDGFRNIAGTDRIGDFELGSISRKINKRIINELTHENVSSLVIPSKNQYRAFFPTAAGSATAAQGMLGAVRAVEQGAVDWEWADLVGIKAYCADTDYINTTETVVHGGYDGYVYEQEQGIAFDGTAIEALYATPHMEFGDAGRRKFVHRITTLMQREGLSSVGLTLRYDFDSNDVIQPASYTLSGNNTVVVYGTALYGTDAYGSAEESSNRQPVSGSGFFAQVRYTSTATTDYPYSIEGIIIEAQLGGRR